MPVATFKDLCIDVAVPATAGRFWAAVLGREWQAQSNGDGELHGPSPLHTVWVNAVPEPKDVKYRVHLDVYTRTLEELVALGATPVEDFPRWTIMADPEGAEFCAFLRDELPAERLHGLVIDCVDPRAVATWWAGVLGTDLELKDGWATVERALWDDVATMDFVPVPEPKTGKNRVHWDVTGSTDELVSRGATVLRRRDDSIGWDVLADPEGNEFCAFSPTD
jgi:hypothetical protein